MTEFASPCPNCGRPRSEYVDLGSHAGWRCWWCHDRAGGAV